MIAEFEGATGNFLNASSVSTADTLVARVIDNGTVSRRQLLIVFVCLFFNMLDGFDITAMAIVAPSVRTELALSPDQLGWIFSVALAGMMGGAMFLAPLSDIVGRRTIIIASVVLVGISILLTANASTITEFIVLRFASGLGAGAMLASQAALTSEYSPAKYRSFAVLAVTAGYPLGAMMTSIVGSYIMPEHGWRGMFWFGGGVTLAMTIVAWLLIPESLSFLLHRRPANALQKVNAILLKLGASTLQELPVSTDEPAKTGAGFFQTMLRLLAPEHRRTTLTLWTTFLFCFATLYFLMSWIPELMEASGYDATVGRKAFLLFNMGGVIGIFLLGWMSTRWKLSNLIFATLFASAIGMIIFAAAPDRLNSLLAIIFVVGLLQQSGFTGLYSAAAKAYPTEMRSTGIGWSIGLGRFGAVAGPALAGYLIAGGLDMAANFYIFAVPMLIGAVLAYRLHIH